MPDGRAPRAAGAVHGEVWIPAGGRTSLQPPAPFLNRRELGPLAAGREGMGSGRRCRGPGRSPDRRGDLLRDAFGGTTCRVVARGVPGVLRRSTPLSART